MLVSVGAVLLLETGGEAWLQPRPLEGATLGAGRRMSSTRCRKTLITLREDAGVSENIAADIVGHENPRITYGLYSGGASLETKAKALDLELELELVKYPS